MNSWRAAVERFAALFFLCHSYCLHANPYRPNHNGAALLLPHKAALSFLGDALKDPQDGFHDRRDVFTTVPRSSVASRKT